MSKEFGETLRFFRRQSELTQKQVAETLHIDRSTYAYYERGTTEPSLNTVRKLAEVFGVELTELLPVEGRVYAKVSDVKKSADFPFKSNEKKLVANSSDEENFLRWYRNLTPEQIAQLRDFAQRINEEKK